MTVVVVGGGISGLVAARRLARNGADVMLLEASGRLGGKVVTHRLGEALVEGGPDWFLIRVPDAVRLCEELGLGGELVPPAVAGALVLFEGDPKRVPPEFVRGVPPSARAALSSGFVSAAGALRMLADYVLPGPLRGSDVSLGGIVRRRLGQEVLERLVDPMLGASRAGAPDEVSLAAAAPELDEAARSSRSLLLALRRRPALSGGAPPFLGIRGGMERLTDALEEDLRTSGVEIRRGRPVERLERAPGGWRVAWWGDTVEADAVLLAVPPPAAAPLLESTAPQATRLLADIPFEAAAVVGLAYPAGTVTAPEGASGVLIPRRERRAVAAFAWFSAKWPHASPPGAPEVLRAFVAGTSARREDLVAAVAREVVEYAGAPPEPAAVAVSAWEHALPVLRVGHLDTIRRLRAALPARLALAGAGYGGSGLPDCIRSGETAARAVLAPRR